MSQTIKLISLFALLLNCFYSDHIPVNPENHDEYLAYKNAQRHFAIFYADWHKESRPLLKDMPILEKKFIDLPIFSVNCDEDNSHLCDPTKMKHLPQIEYFDRGVTKVTSGMLGVDSVIEWIKTLKEEPVLFIKTEGDVEKFNKWIKTDYAALLYKGKMDEERKKMVEELAFRYEGNIRTYQVEKEELYKGLAIEELNDGLYLYRNRKQRVLPYDLASGTKGLKKFLQRNRYKQLVVLTPEKWKEINDDESELGYAFYFFDTDCSNKERTVIKKIFTYYRLQDLAYFRIVKRKNPEFFNQLKSHFGVPEVCAFVIAKRVNEFTYEKFLYTDFFTTKRIASLMDKFKKKELPIYLKSKSSGNFEKNEIASTDLSTAVNNYDKHIFILFFAKRSVDSDIMKKFTSLIDTEDSKKAYKCFKIDLDENDISEFDIYQEPLIIFFNKNDKGNPLEYAEEVNEDSMMKFIEDNKVESKLETV